MSALKPSEEIQIAAITATIVFGIFSIDTPGLADVRASQPGTGNAQHVHATVKSAAWTSAVLVSGIALLAKNPTIFVVGGAMIVAESWKYYHANAISPATGKLPAGAGQQGS